MLAFFFDPHRRIVLASFADAVSIDDLGALQARARCFAQAQGRVPLILDFTAAMRMDIPTEAIVALGRAPPLMDGERCVYVASGGETYGLGRLFITHQILSGFTPSLLARSLDEALRKLELADPRFEPWPAALTPRASELVRAKPAG